MSKESFLNQYSTFVDGITSVPSKSEPDFFARLRQLYSQDCDVARLMTGAIGLASEGGEVNEIVKKIVFQGKPYDADNIAHLKIELGDVIWYWINTCIALGFDPYDVITANVAKLESRYPGGKFSIERSEVREPGDL
jgi:NTP pyrophosphatase (non-canonical NTP hydrolase)